MHLEVAGTSSSTCAWVFRYKAGVTKPMHHLPDQAVAERGLRCDHARGHTGIVSAGQLIHGKDYVNEVPVAEKR